MRAEPIDRAKAISKQKRFVKRNFLAKKHHGYTYYRYRVLRPLLKLYTHWQRNAFRPHPWLTPAAIHIFNEVLSPDMDGLEYGSGSSTLFFASRLRSLVSIEHHDGWYGKVSQMLVKHRLEHVDLHLITENENISTADENFNIPGFVPKKSFRDYYNKVNEYPDLHFDFILIDGRARVECIANSIPKLSNGGILALDNSERERYRPVFDILSDWPVVQTTNGLTDTTIWFKP